MGRISQSDEEKKRNGTFDPRYSEEKRTAEQAQKIVAGPWLPKIPEPAYPLQAEGKTKYDELTRMLFEAGTLSLATAELCSLYALSVDAVHQRLSVGKQPTSDMIKRMEAMLAKLRVAENAQPIALPGQAKGRFDGIGQRNSHAPPIRLRSHPAR